VMGIAIQPDQRIVLGFGIGGRVALHRTTPDGSPDPDFNPELTPLSFLRTIVPSHDPKGRLLLEGLTPAGGTESILRINSDGSPDSTFNSSGLSGDRIDEIQGVADGRVLVAGEIDIGSDPALKLAFLERDGSITPLARVTSPGSLAKVIPLPDGKLMVSGRFEEVDGTRLHRLARLNSGGTVDPTFSTRGLVARYVTGSYWFTNLLFDALAPQPGGRLLVGLEGIYPYEVVRLHGDGSVDPSLEPFQADGYGNTLALTLPDGGVIFAGFSVGGYSWGTVHELTPVGAYVPVLIPPYEASYLGLSGLAAQSDGRAVAAISSSGLYRGSPDGTLDRTFRPPFPRDTQFHDLKVDASDRILVAHSASPGLVSLSRLLPNGRVDPSFHPDWLRAPGNTLEPRTLSLLPDGRLFVVAVRTLHGNETAVVLRLRPDGDLDGGFPEIPLEHAPSSQLIDAQGGLLLTGVEPGVISRVAGGDPEPSTPVSESALKERVLYAGSDLSLYMAASGFPSPEYQWFRDGNAIPGATRSLLTVTNVQPGDAGLYTVVLSNPHGTASPAGARVTVIPTVSLATALDGPDLRWSTAPTLDSGSAWVGVLDVSHDGRHSARNIPLEEGGSAPLWIDCPVSGTLSFWWKVSSEAGYDVLQFQLGQRIPIQISGETAWANLSFEVMAGERARWSYLKDGSGSVGSDCGWVDQVVFTPRAAPPIPFKTFTPLPDGRVQLGWLTVPGRPASLEASSNLIDWQVLTNLIGTGLEIPFIDAEAATMPWRFYRVTER
ncbi:MAG TPA: hypothetical protein DCM86_15385, partial [Verrucomicrobiales bacterium]|nr:hypothetical protein [Verrucomicrobiales bacterium]